jgi:hypothetical protein
MNCHWWEGYGPCRDCCDCVRIRCQRFNQYHPEYGYNCQNMWDQCEADCHSIFGLPW